MAFQRVARVEEVPPGQSKYVCAGSSPVLLANYEGRVYALSGICPHQHNPLDGARMWGPLIDCPFHHFQYDVRTGENYYPRNVYPRDMPRIRDQLQPLAVYSVKVENGAIWVDLETQPAERT